MRVRHVYLHAVSVAVTVATVADQDCDQKWLAPEWQRNSRMPLTSARVKLPQPAQCIRAPSLLGFVATPRNSATASTRIHMGGTPSR
jgi:hypothetical protein